MRVPWHRSHFVRLFAIGSLIALIAVAAATYATVRATTAQVQQEQQQSLRTDAQTYDELIGYAATHRTWAGADALVDRLARSSGLPVAVTDLAGRPLVTSSDALTSYDPADARATLDPLDIETSLLVAVSAPANVTDSGPVAGPVDVRCTGGGPCVPHVVAPVSTLDPRVLEGADKQVARAVERAMSRVDACLDRKGLARASSYGADLSVEVSYTGKDAAVARCLDAAKRAELSPLVAPVALLFIGADGARAAVSLDLSGGSQAQIALLAGAVLAVTLLLCALLAGSVSRPLRRMAAAALRTREGDLTVRVPDTRRDEVGQVAGVFAATAEAGGVALAVDVAPGASVWADPLRLRQVIDNLVANAVRHTARGGHVTLRGAPGIVHVVDDGEGLSATDAAHVFDRFHRVDASRTRDTGGSGLGLAIVRQVIEAHGGSVDLTSAPGVGTTVTIVLTTA